MQARQSATLRSHAPLPSLPDEHEASRRFPSWDMVRAHFDQGRLIFDRQQGLDRALAAGFFLLRIPGTLQLEASDRFARHFFQEQAGGDLAAFTGYKQRAIPGDYQGYFDREHDQWENFYIERRNWSVLPVDVTHAGQGMADLGLAVLRSVLQHLKIPADQWPLVTGGLTAMQGHQMLAFNHFRPDKAVRGSKFHRDSGWVTVLRSTSPGLLAYINGGLHSINPEPGHFIVNFGSSLEVLTAQMSRPVRANIHGVARTIRTPGQAHRVSYVIFLDSDLSGDIYQYRDDAPVKVQSVKEFAIQEVGRTYDKFEQLL